MPLNLEMQLLEVAELEALSDAIRCDTHAHTCSLIGNQDRPC